MTEKIINNWIMYHEIHKLSRLGFKKAKIAHHTGLDARTVGKYLAMDEEQFEQHLLKAQRRKKVLSCYEDFVKDKLDEFPSTSAAQIHDWLKEHHNDLPDVSARTVYNFVMYVRQVYNIPYIKHNRDFLPIEELPYGQQAQVDFGEYNMRTVKDKRKKVYFFAMVLSRSRMKFVWFIDTPFTANHVCQAHENAFSFFDGVPKEVVYDLDRAMVVNENLGDIMLTTTFKQYVDSKSFSRHFCRKADPESKGKVENVVKYTKQNFLFNRAFYDIDSLNAEAFEWLDRTANHLPHNVTKKSPASEFDIEKGFLDPHTPALIENKQDKTYQVRKDNTFAYKSNFYSLPIGTYKGSHSKVIIREEQGLIGVYDLKEEHICMHKRSSDKGKLIINNNHKRDRSKSINDFMRTTAQCFTDEDAAMSYLKQIRKRLPRYTRDHLQLILKTFKTAEDSEQTREAADKALDHCIKNELFHASDFEKVFWMMVDAIESPKAQVADIKPLGINCSDKVNQEPEKSNIDDYEQLLNL